MGAILVDKNKCNLCGECIRVCPFGAIDEIDGSMEINAACKMCKICIKQCPQEAMEYTQEQKTFVNKNEWVGILVYVEHIDGEIHPITYELIGKALELSRKINHPIYCLMVGSNIVEKASELLKYGVEKVFVYDHVELMYYAVDVYANAFEDCIKRIKPSIVLVGGTSVGRSLAPRVSTRFKTGLTADCTKLDVKENTDLDQIRPAFGGNIMAHIVTSNSRPQFATVRYKVMDEALCSDTISGRVERFYLEGEKLSSGIKVLKVVPKAKEIGITEAEILVVAGRGVREQKDLILIEDFANVLGGQVAVTRPLVENGWASYTKQIGLSGRTVKPKLIITCGVSGAIQFSASMNASQTIMAINKDNKAPIFKISHYGIVGDLYEIIPKLIRKIEGGEAICDIKE